MYENLLNDFPKLFSKQLRLTNVLLSFRWQVLSWMTAIGNFAMTLHILMKINCRCFHPGLFETFSYHSVTFNSLNFQKNLHCIINSNDKSLNDSNFLQKKIALKIRHSAFLYIFQIDFSCSAIN